MNRKILFAPVNVCLKKQLTHYEHFATIYVCLMLQFCAISRTFSLQATLMFPSDIPYHFGYKQIYLINFFSFNFCA